MKKSLLWFSGFLVLFASGAPAAVLTWTGNAGNGNWSQSANWNAPATPALGDSLIFNNAAQTSQTATTVSLNTITWGSSAGAFTVTGGTVTLNQSGGGLVNSGTLTQTLGSNVTFSSTAQTIDHGTGVISVGGPGAAVAINTSLVFNGSGTTGFTGNITYGTAPTLTVNAGTVTFHSGIGETGGSRSMIKAGAGRLELLGSNSFSGNFTLAAGTVVAGSNTAFGTGSFNLSSGGATVGTLESLGGADRTFVNNVTLQRTLNVQGGGVLTFSGSTGSFGSSPIINIAAGTTLRVNNALTGSSIVNKNGAGKLVLGGENSFSGNLSVNEGELELTNTAGAGAGTGNLTIASGAMLSGTGRLANGSVLIGGTLSPGGNADGTLNFALTNKVTFQSTSVLALQGGDLLSFTTLGDWIAVTLGAKIDLSGEGWNVGWNTFASNISTLPAGIGTNWTLTTASANAGFALDNLQAFRVNGNELQLNLSAIPEPSTTGLALAGLVGAIVFLRRKAGAVKC